MIQKEWQYTATCDICGAMDIMAFVSQTQFVHELRKRYGWRVFRNSDGRLMSFCPKCRERRKKERGVTL